VSCHKFIEKPPSFYSASSYPLWPTYPSRPPSAIPAYSAYALGAALRPVFGPRMVFDTVCVVANFADRTGDSGPCSYSRVRGGGFGVCIRLVVDGADVELVATVGCGGRGRTPSWRG
jgi:hypothetical protein